MLTAASACRGPAAPGGGTHDAAAFLKNANDKVLHLGNEPQRTLRLAHVNLTHTGTVPGAGAYHTFAVSADGQRFLIPQPPLNDAASLTMPIVVVENWAAGIPK